MSPYSIEKTCAQGVKTRFNEHILLTEKKIHNMRLVN